MSTKRFFFITVLTAVIISGCNADKGEAKSTSVKEVTEETATATTETATFAMGCFWHSEEMFLEIKGVKDAKPGYCGGTQNDPSYESVSSGNTGYAESVNVTYDPSVISFQKLLEVFFAEHDPTTPNMQYPDEGPQYRSAVFYHSNAQKKQIDAYIKKLTDEHRYSKPIVTEVAPFKKFYQAEDYHLRYYRNHPTQSYIAHVTEPEIQKFRKDFPDLVKK